jgi:hypothetical protein
MLCSSECLLSPEPLRGIIMASTTPASVAWMPEKSIAPQSMTPSKA